MHAKVIVNRKQRVMMHFLIKNIFSFVLLCSVLVAQARDTTKTAKQDFRFGGALRFNYVTEFYDGGYEPLDSYITTDTWFFTVDGSRKGIDLSFEYRFYPTLGSQFIHHGYFGFNILDSLYATLGVNQVPFGNTGRASHSWWFQGPYYIGLEEDYDIGAKLHYTGISHTQLTFAYYRESEPEGPGFAGDVSLGNAGPGRYSYDITYCGPGIVADTTASLRELNHFHFRATYRLWKKVTIGGSGQVGTIYNKTLKTGDITTAFAAHINADLGKMDFRGQYIYYDYQARDDAGNKLSMVPLGAYGFKYPVAARAYVYMAGMGYTIDLDAGPLEKIQAYVDYSLFDKTHENHYNTHHLVPGVMAKIGNIYTYIDLAIGKNHPWLTDEFGSGMGAGRKNAPWNKRFNVNVGYYF